MYECESWTIKKAECQRTEAFELWCWRRLESPLDSKEIKPINPKGNQSWIFIGGTDAEAPILWPPDVKNQLIRKDPVAGKNWKQEKGMTEDEMVGCHHQLNGHEFEQSLGDGEGQGSLACCSPWGCKVSDTTEWLNWTEDISWAFPPVSFLACFSIGLEFPAWSFSLVKSLWNFIFEKASLTVLANANGTLNFHPSS